MTIENERSERRFHLPDLGAASFGKVLAIIAAGAAVGGCSVLAPGTSKALSEEAQTEIMRSELEEMKKQTAAQERSAHALEKIADNGSTPGK